MKALIFDCDGVLADTELHGHLVAFNRMWQKAGVPWRWSEEQYAEKLKIGGGKERMRALFSEPAFQAVHRVPNDEAAQKELLAQWHAQKTAIYQEIIASGNVPGRIGIKRLAEEALTAGWLLAVASTSAKPSVDAVLRLPLETSPPHNSRSLLEISFPRRNRLRISIYLHRKNWVFRLTVVSPSKTHAMVCSRPQRPA